MAKNHKLKNPVTNPRGNGKMLLYNMFPRHYSSLAEATNDLARVGKRGLGYNAVWINPINASSELIVNRYNVLTHSEQKVKGSLYATRDFSTLNTSLFPELANVEEVEKESTGDPGYCTLIEHYMLHRYTNIARANGMMPIFDLVLGHVAADSPLVKGTFSHFKQLGIDTSRWFKAPLEMWDDVVPFHYEDPLIREEIIDYLWMPYIKKYISKFGFMGVRVDFAAGFPCAKAVEQALFPKINQLVENQFEGIAAIIFGEVLPSRDTEEICREFRDLYTHVTNCSLFNPENSNHDIGIKQQLTHIENTNTPHHMLRGGTIGFSGSHDNGPNARNALTDRALETIHNDQFKRHIYLEGDGKKRSVELERTITELVNSAMKNPEEMRQWMMEQKKRIAICALISDGGTYLLSGDEFGDPTPRSVFSDLNGQCVYNEPDAFAAAKNSKKIDHSVFIKNLNAAISDMPRSIFPHWSKVVHLDMPYNHLLIVMNYNGDGFSDRNPELTIVNLTENTVELTENLIKHIAQKNKEGEHDNLEAYEAVLNSNKRAVGNFVAPLFPTFKLYNQTLPPENRINKTLSESNSASFFTNENKIDEMNIESVEKISSVNNTY